MMIPKDYYKILGLERTASKAEIKKAYYALARKYHPDLHNEEEYFINKFNEISEAYYVLGDLDRRLDYSLTLFRYEEIREEAVAKLKELQIEMKKQARKDKRKVN